MGIASSPEAIERDAERRMDALDAALLSGRMSQAAYDAEVRKLDRYTRHQYARWDAHRTQAAWRAPEWHAMGAR